MIYNCNSEIDENQIKPVLTDLSRFFFPPAALQVIYKKVYIYIYIYIYISHTHTHIYIYIYTHTHTYTYIFTFSHLADAFIQSILQMRTMKAIKINKRAKMLKCYNKTQLA